MRTTRTSTVHAKAVGREFARARRELELTQEQLAKRLGVNPSYVAAIETGRVNPTVGQLAHLARALGAQLQITLTIPERARVTLPDMAQQH
jgi:transcriptional regulator with XRE-family HTH domain